MCQGLGIKPRKAIPVVQWATMGQRRGTSLFRVLPLLGPERTFERINSARRPSLDQMSQEMRDAIAPAEIDNGAERSGLGEIRHGDDLEP